MRNMTIGKKIGLTCAALVGFTVLLAAISLLGLRTLTAGARRLQVDCVPGQYASGKVQSLAIAVRVKMNAELLDLAVNGGKNAARVEADLTAAGAAFQEGLKTYEKTITQAEDRQLFEKLEPAYDRFSRSWTHVRATARTAKPEEVFSLYKAETLPAFDELQQGAEKLIAWNNTAAAEVAEETAKAAATASLWNWAFALIAVLCGSAAGVFHHAVDERQLAADGVRTGRRSRAGGERRLAGVVVQPVAGAGLLRAGGVARRDLRVERGDQLHGAQEHREFAHRRRTW